ncbi:hypothetical protein EDD16DRAFT_1515889 [Pisolithus croceorrhizus]|nr:hypothetical protein EDD16DRAFT_1515889 [Pisolithus croceorrhizus]KAI6135880.1 hypothetical protein EV401DRAFT_1881935 [Pisolithus croceorrhizus]
MSSTIVLETGALALPVPVYEECERTMKTQQWIGHHKPSDFILNTAQMHDATQVQQFHIQAQQLDYDWAIHMGAAAKFDAQKLKAQKLSKTDPARRPAASPTAVPSHFINIFHCTGDSM